MVPSPTIQNTELIGRAKSGTDFSRHSVTSKRNIIGAYNIYRIIRTEISTEFECVSFEVFRPF